MKGIFMPRLHPVFFMIAIISGLLFSFMLSANAAIISGLALVLMYLLLPNTVSRMFKYDWQMIGAGYLFGAFLFAKGVANLMFPIISGDAGFPWGNLVAFLIGFFVMVKYVWPLCIDNNDNHDNGNDDPPDDEDNQS